MKPFNFVTTERETKGFYPISIKKSTRFIEITLVHSISTTVSTQLHSIIFMALKIHHLSETFGNKSDLISESESEPTT